MDERRIKTRWGINQGAELTVENGVKPIPCVVEDISNGGVRLSLRRDLFDEVFSNFRLAISGGPELSIGAQVAWRQRGPESNTYGLSFSSIDNDSLEGLNRYIRDNFNGLIIKHWWEGSLNA
ncbi:MAG: PilZ domain-containing protein [Candidatus Omnitrophica bacterium]|nr:PilZ domain-containing protein [Candidatus Omnitrophota bacterium]MDD5500340.1 PilZ domain-containing protein [Candidatus Omnitrophota bacterium]